MFQNGKHIMKSGKHMKKKPMLQECSSAHKENKKGKEKPRRP
jgi:hypothetical protein